VHGITFVNTSIRRTRRQAFYSTGTTLRLGLRWFGGVIENCGLENAGGGGTWIPAFSLNALADADFFGLELRNNYSGGVHVSVCDNVRFWGCRFNDTAQDWNAAAAGQSIHTVAANSLSTKFIGCRMIYLSTSQQYWANIASETLLDGCDVVDNATGNAAALYVDGSAVLAMPNTTFSGCLAPASQYLLNRAGLYTLATGAGKTVDQVITALQALGLVKQS
jgi:hypothetical protein